MQMETYFGREMSHRGNKPETLEEDLGGCHGTLWADCVPGIRVWSRLREKGECTHRSRRMPACCMSWQPYIRSWYSSCCGTPSFLEGEWTRSLSLASVLSNMLRAWCPCSLQSQLRPSLVDVADESLCDGGGDSQVMTVLVQGSVAAAFRLSPLG